MYNFIVTYDRHFRNSNTKHTCCHIKCCCSPNKVCFLVLFELPIISGDIIDMQTLQEWYCVHGTTLASILCLSTIDNCVYRWTVLVKEQTRPSVQSVFALDTLVNNTTSYTNATTYTITTVFHPHYSPLIGFISLSLLSWNIHLSLFVLVSFPCVYSTQIHVSYLYWT